MPDGPTRRREFNIRIVADGVRSLKARDENPVPIRPLTLLVGENSSGKSTFLAIVATVLDPDRFPLNVRFNQAPYNLGSFRTVVATRRGSRGTAREFSIGFIEGERGAARYRELVASYRNHAGRPGLAKLRAANRHGELHLDFGDDEGNGKLLLRSGEMPETFPVTVPTLPGKGLGRWWDLIPFMIDDLGSWPDRQKQVSNFFDAFRLPVAPIYSLAPIRSRPRRTYEYDDFDEDYSPEGLHVPLLLARLLQQEPTTLESRRVQRALTEFGAESGLFRKIDAVRKGTLPTDPIRLRVAVSGVPHSLSDVGYGVSQALPIVVESSRGYKRRILLIQQPEVHVHPRAQAAMGSFFCRLAATGDQVLLVETHSDHLVDRVRQEVAAGNIPARDVVVLFFDKPRHETTIYPIALDDDGNVQDAPPSYREFFLQEAINLFHRSNRG